MHIILEYTIRIYRLLVHFGSKPIAGSQGKGTDVFAVEEIFAVYIPLCPHIPRRQPARTRTTTSGIRPFVVQHGIGDILTFIAIRTTGRKGDATVVLLGKCEIVVALVEEFLENQRIGKYLITAIILNAVALKRCNSAVGIANFGKTKGFEVVVLVQGAVIINRQAPHIAFERGFRFIENTPIGERYLWRR